MIKLTFCQPHFESGSISGEGIDWWWGGRDLSGPEEDVETIVSEAYSTIREKYGDHLTEEAMEDLDLGIEAEIDWDGDTANVTEAKIKLDFWDCWDKDKILTEAQENFTTKLKSDERGLALGTNKIELGKDKEGNAIEIEINIETKP